MHEIFAIDNFFVQNFKVHDTMNQVEKENGGNHAERFAVLSFDCQPL